MKFNSALLALSVLFSGMVSANITGTTSAQMTFKTTLKTGTCTAIVVNGSGKNVSTIGYGDVFKSDIGTRIVPLKIQFSACDGVNTATVVAKAGSGGVCSGKAYDAGAATNTAFEIWGGEGGVASGIQLACTTPPAAQEVTITSGAGEYPMESRMVVADGKTIADVTAGAATAPVTFVVAYP
ncbi:TPA: fimbrial protein [Salmonella enterica subsp. salamae serovar 28:r:e,n,z15]|nr:fimbrial protein [Salmonella enterica subsp. salamae serovar 28:r:e,n,z15]